MLHNALLFTDLTMGEWLWGIEIQQKRNWHYISSWNLLPRQ